MIWFVLLVVAAVMGVVIYFAMKSHNKMVADGKIISRRTNFMESAEEFTLSAVYPAQVTEAVKAIDYAEMRTKMQGSNEQQLFKFTGSTWSAQLHKLRDNGTQVVYRFEFTNWKTHNGMPQDGLNMNKLTTAVEKIFLSLDPNTQVRTVPLEFNIAFVCIALLMIVVGYIGNKIVDKGSDAIRNKAVRKKNLGNPSEPESLADRFENGRKL